ncbi:hypothetical protein BO79DRAFT_236436 [Aspergillus costaricaensis CBS 115574]|uniref:Uncharacterized protein n=1 Tax=Aspergillus costaricaensis CBS 115574 TaxID=1448317 RepID=A0ACD1IMR8_9EURO|nr:hypothetical protein BO79DRAFT_236436 [Aspergillus costaricaensis CBS 115574]RAK91335.1 hypothetical protein BO79DRAFT_236436 [Aspergillus costaricaensis CBS 115574]
MGNLTSLSHEESAPMVAPRYEEHPDRQAGDSTPVLQRTKPNREWEKMEKKNNRHDPLDPKRPKKNAEMQLKKLRAEEINQTSNAPPMQVCQMTTTRAMVETPRPVACYHGRGGLSPGVGVGDIDGRTFLTDNPSTGCNGDIAPSKLSRMRGDDSAHLLGFLGSSPPSGVGPDPVTEPSDPLDKKKHTTLFLPVWGLLFKVSEKSKYPESRGYVSIQTLFSISATR